MNIISNVKTVAIKGYMKLRKYSPEIALAGSIACGVGAVVTAIIATNKLHEKDIINKAHEELNEISATAETYPSINIKKESFKVYINTAIEIGKIYAAPVGLTFASVGLGLAAHGILKSRYIHTVAYAEAVDEAFKSYRERVAEIVGDDAEKIIRSGGRTEKDVKVIDDQDNVEKVKGNNLVMNGTNNSPYDFDFNRHTAPMTWEPNPDYSEAFLRAQQNYFNDILVARGHVFLNEILDAIGLERTSYGAICGWIKGHGSDYIDFGYMPSFMRDYNIDSDLCKRNIHLCFNCDGTIWDKI